MEAKKSIGVLKIIFKTFFRPILVLKKILDKTQIRRGKFGRLEKIYSSNSLTFGISARAIARRDPKNDQDIIKNHTISKICCLVYNIDTPRWGMLYLGLKGVSNRILDILLRGKPKEWD